MTFARTITPSLRELVSRVLPGAELLSADALSADDATERDAATAKGAGYGEPLRLKVREASGRASGAAQKRR